MDLRVAVGAEARSVMTASAAGERSPPRGGDGGASLFARAEGVLHCAFQPIVDVHNGVVYGVEAFAGL